MARRREELVVAGTQAREPLSRARILRAALAYVDDNGLAALSMHKLGAELGVTAMSLYGYVDGKEGLLDGVVEAVWAEVGVPEERPSSWQQDVRTLAQSLREVVRRHPEAARLLMSRPIMPIPALEFFDTYLRRLVEGGLAEARAPELVRSVVAYAFGFALFELTWAQGAQGSAEADDDLRSFRHVSSIVPQDTPERLFRTALVLCTRCDLDAQFRGGIDLMLRSLETEDQPATPPS